MTVLHGNDQGRCKRDASAKSAVYNGRRAAAAQGVLRRFAPTWIISCPSRSEPERGMKARSGS